MSFFGKLFEDAVKRLMSDEKVFMEILMIDGKAKCLLSDEGKVNRNK